MSSRIEKFPPVCTNDEARAYFKDKCLCYDDKPNGKAAPLPIAWEQDYGGGIFPQCPACGEMPYSLDRCTFFGQRFIKDDRAKEWEQPPEEVRMDCFVCGCHNTVAGTRARSNGHFHGQCEKCGCRMME